MKGELSIRELLEGYAADAFRVADVVSDYLQRIEKIDTQGPKLNSVVELNPDALEIAEALDAQKSAQGPLHGIPVVLKDSIDTADSMATTGGSLALIENRADEDAFLVKKLREAGAVILGKTNMSEWGYMRSTRACSGWSSRGGQTRNPHVLDRSPLGSSSGSAVAVAANLSTFSIGAEVDGSIVRPASANGIVGIKPTVGLISRSGMMGVAAPQDTAGPFARSVEDLAAALNVLAGPDPDDAASSPCPATDYLTSLNKDALRGKRLGLAREAMGCHEGTDAVIEKAVETLHELGAEVIDPVQASTLPFFGELELELFQYGVKDSIDRYLAAHPRASVKSLQELIDYNREHAAVVMPYFKQEFFELAVKKGNLSEPRYAEIVRELQRLSRTEGIDRCLREHRLDAIIAPTEGSPAFAIDLIAGDKILPGGCSSPPAVAGYPHITVPAGFVHHLPVGLSFFGGVFEEAKLIAFAYAFEQATDARRTPQYLPSLPL